MTASADSADSEIDVNKRVHDEVTMNDEISSIIQSICNTTNDCLRPFIIHESSIDELCKVINILSEDIKSQIIASSSLTAASPTTPSSSTTHVSKKLIDFLLKSLDRSMSDTQERLVYCAEVRLRQDIQLFEPLPHNLLYPEILQDITTSTTTINQSSDFDSSDITKTWYPTLKSTLMLLSKLYGIIDMNIFEDFSRSIPSSAIYFGSYETAKTIGGNIASSVIFVPKDVIKQQLQAFRTNSKVWSGSMKINDITTIDVMKKIFKSKGLKGFFPSYRATLMRNIPAAVIRFTLYEELKILAEANKSNKFNDIKYLLAGGIASMLSSAATTPIDMIKTRFATGVIPAGTPIWQALVDVAKTEGVSGLYAGVHVRLLYSAAFGGVGFYCFEACKKLLGR
eukprot:gene17495-23050_t